MGHPWTADPVKAVEDDTGMCLVDLHDADDDLTVGTVLPAPSTTHPIQNLQPWRLGLSSENLLGMNRRFRYRETILQKENRCLPTVRARWTSTE